MAPNATFTELRVLEVASGSIAASFCGKVLRRLGAQVVKLEQPSRLDSLRKLPPYLASETPQWGLPFHFLNFNKRFVFLDLNSSEEDRQAALHLVERYDVLIQGGTESADVPFDADIRAGAPSLIAVTVTPLGAHALRDGVVADDFVAYHRSGLGYITPRAMPGFPTAGLRPLRPYARLLEIIAGLQAAVAVLAALEARRRTGRGDWIDIAAFQCALPLIRRELAAYQYTGAVATRGERLWKIAPAGIQRCRDGYVFVDVIEDSQWRSLCSLIGQENLTDDPRFANVDSRYAHSEALTSILDSWFLKLSRREASELGQARSIPIAPVNAPRDLFRDPQLDSRAFFYPLPVEDDRTILVPDLPLERGAQVGISKQHTVDSRFSVVDGLGETILHSETVRSRLVTVGSIDVEEEAPSTGKPLKGIRILEFTHVWAGPLCGQILADLGAEVIRVESRRHLDIHRTGGPYAGNQPGINRSGVWNSQNRGKFSCTLNLATADGRELARQLTRFCDGIIENFSPGTMDRLGLGFDSLRAIRSDIVLVSLSAYGQTGPHRNYVGYGPMMDAGCGIMSLTGYGDAIPRAVNGWAGDISGALFGAIEMLDGLLVRRSEGRWVDVSEYEGAILFQFEALLAWADSREDVGPVGNLSPYGGFTECFRCAGRDQWVAVSAATRQQLSALAALAGYPLPLNSVQPVSAANCYKGLIEATELWIKNHDRAEAIRLFDRAGVPCGIVSDVSDLYADPILRSRGAFIETHHSEIGRFVSYGPVWQFAESKIGSPLAPPCLGENNDYVFGSLLGLDKRTIAELESRQVIY